MSSYQPTLAYAQSMDAADVLHANRALFHIPQHNGKDTQYFCGNSLGLQPKRVQELMLQELKDWATYGVEGHFKAANPWFAYHHLFSNRMANIVGALPDEVVVMNTLTVNLHLLMQSFYRPTKERYKIIMEAGAFPSDQYAMETQAIMHGFDPNDAIIEISPRAGEHTINEEDIYKAIAEAGSQLALVMFGGVNYYTGQLFNIKAITKAAHDVGAYAGFDLAHATGNVTLHLHDWKVDFACWCTYKYLNSGPGSVGGVFVNERFGDNPAFFRLAGWWGNEEKTRFLMQKGFKPQKGAASWQMSNAPVFNMVALNASLELYANTNMSTLVAKSKALTGYAEFLLKQLTNVQFNIITPAQPEARGCQLSLLFDVDGKAIFNYLTDNGVIADWREPNVIRIAPVPMYNTFEDVYTLYHLLEQYK